MTTQISTPKISFKTSPTRPKFAAISTLSATDVQRRANLHNRVSGRIKTSQSVDGVKLSIA